MTTRLAALLSAFICVHLWLLLLPAEARLQSSLRFAAGAPIELPIGDDAGPQAIALADVNADGTPDLIAVDRYDDEVRVLIGSGDGGFGAARVYPLDGTPAAVAVADVASPFGADTVGDIDGHVDVIVAHDDGYAEILLGRGDGDFDPPEQDLSDILAGIELNAVAVRDLDGNGRLDLIFLDAFDEVFFLCNEAGVYAPCPTESVCTDGFGALAMAVGDFTGAGRDDVAVLSRDSGDLRIIKGLGGGRFDELDRVVVPLVDAAGEIEVTSLAVGRLHAEDVDDDELDDLLVGTSAPPPDPPPPPLTLVYRQGATIGVLPQPIGPPVLPQYFGPLVVDAVTLADFDADGADDALTHGSSGLELATGADDFTTSGAPTGTEALPGLRALVPVDLDGDGRLDFAAISADGSAVIALRNVTDPFCAGDCGADGTVTIDELLRGVNAALGLLPADECGAIDPDRSSTVEINELIAAVGHALDGCPAIL